MKKIIIATVLIILVGLGGYFLYERILGTDNTPIPEDVNTGVVPGEQPGGTVAEEEENKIMTVIGKSAEDRDITAYHFGEGDKELLFVGGIHGGYEWNTVLVAYELMDYLKENPQAIPENVKVTVVP